MRLASRIAGAGAPAASRPLASRAPRGTCSSQLPVMPLLREEEKEEVPALADSSRGSAGGAANVRVRGCLAQQFLSELVFENSLTVWS